MRTWLFGMAALAVVGSPAVARKTPYWASLNAGEVMMRKGPGREFPADWLYKRRGLPVKVLQVYTNAKIHAEWRKIEDPDHAVGWVQANLLSDARTALVVGDVRPMREKPAADAAVVWKAEPGVVGRISNCANGWCSLDVHGRSGFIEMGHIFGVEPGDKLP